MNDRLRKWVPLVLALLSAIYVYWSMSQSQRTSPVVVAAIDLKAGMRLDAASVTEVHLPVRAVHPRAARSVRQVLGQYVLCPVVAGEQLLGSKISLMDPQAAIVASLPAGYRAFFVPLDTDRAGGGAVRAGMAVDLIYVPRATPLGGEAAMLLLPRVEVLEVLTEQASPAGRIPQVRGVLVKVLPHEAEEIAYCLERGSIFLALAPPAEPTGAGARRNTVQREGEG